MTDREFLDQLFETEYCQECGGDTQHHTVTRAVFGLPFAFCNYPPDEEGAPHIMIQTFRSQHAH